MRHSLWVLYLPRARGSGLRSSLDRSLVFLRGFGAPILWPQSNGNAPAVRRVADRTVRSFDTRSTARANVHYFRLGERGNTFAQMLVMLCGAEANHLTMPSSMATPPM